MSWMFRCAPGSYRSIAPYNHSRDSVSDLHLSPYDGLSEVHILRKFSLLVLVGVFGWAPWMFGQSAGYATGPKLEWYVGYSAIETNDHVFQFRGIGPVGDLDYDEKGRGFEAAAILNVRCYFAIVGEFSAHFSSNGFLIPVQTNCSQPPCASVTQPLSINPRIFYFLAGPEFKWRNRTRFTPFINGLAGIANSHATLTTSGAAVDFSTTEAESGFALAADGGLEVRIAKRYSFRGYLIRSGAFVGSPALPHQKVGAAGWSAGILFH